MSATTSELTPWRRSVLLLGGHESLPGQNLGESAEPAGARILGPGRELQAAVRERSRIVAVPMTLGRDRELAAVAAQTLSWAARGRAPGDLLLAGPLGTTGHLVGWIRAAAGRVLRDGPPRQAVLLVAPAAGPEPDAELFRVARLVWQYLPARWVEVALTDGDPNVDEGVERCRRLGADGVVLVPASFVPAPVRADTRTAGALLGPAALTELIRERVTEAERRWTRRGDDGLSAAAAEHHHDDHDHHRGFPTPAVTNPEGAPFHGG